MIDRRFCLILLGFSAWSSTALASPTVFHVTGSATRYSPIHMPPDISRAHWTGPQSPPAEEPAYDASLGGYPIDVTIYGSEIVAGACRNRTVTYSTYTKSNGQFDLYANDWEPSCGGWAALAFGRGGESYGVLRSQTSEITASFAAPLVHLPSLPTMYGPYWARRVGTGSKPIFFVEGFDPGDDRTRFDLPLEDGTPVTFGNRTFTPEPGSQYIDENASWGGVPTIVNVSDTTAILYMLAEAKLNTNIALGLAAPPASAYAGYVTSAPNQPNMLAYLLQNDYSLYIVTASRESGESIRGLAGDETGAAFQAIATIRNILYLNHNGKQAIIGGHSQGGLVVRDGLKKWCDGTWQSLYGLLTPGCPEVALWYALDSPLEGARLPPEIQALMRDPAYSDTGGNRALLGSPAAREMLVEYIDPSAQFQTGCFDGGANCRSDHSDFWTCRNNSCRYDTTARDSLTSWETADPWPRRERQVVPAIAASFGESPNSTYNSDYLAHAGGNTTGVWAHLVAYSAVAGFIPAGAKVDLYGNSANTPGAPARPAATAATPNPIDYYAAGSISGAFDTLKNALETENNDFGILGHPTNIADIRVRPTFIPSQSALAWNTGGQSNWRAHWHQAGANPAGGYQHLGALSASPGLIGFLLGYWDEYSAGAEMRVPDGYGWKVESASSGYGSGRAHIDGDCLNGIDDDGDGRIDNAMPWADTPQTTTICNPALHDRVLDSKEPNSATYTNASQCVWNGYSDSPAPWGGSSQAYVCTVSPWLLGEPVANGGSMHQPIGKADSLYFDVWIDPDPNNQPQLIVLEVGVAGSFEHRAYWGYDHAQGPWTRGVDGTASFKYQGPLPPRGTWTRLKVAPSDLGLTGLTVDALAWAQVGGRIAYGRIGLTSFTETILIDDGLPANLQTDGTAWNWSSTPVLSGGASHANLQNYNLQQHYVYGGAITGLYANDELSTWTYDALNGSSLTTGEIMLQFHSPEDGWEHRAYWGMNTIAWGIDQSPSRLRMSLISGTYWESPSFGARWGALRVGAASVGLANRVLDGLAYSQSYGTNYFDRTSVLRDAVAWRPELTDVPLSSRWNRDRCIALRTGNGSTAVQAWDCDAGPSQRWNFVPSRYVPDLPGLGEMPGGTFMIQAAGGCLQVQAGSRSDGALIELQPCVSFGDPLYDAQQWASVRPDASASDGSFQLRNQRSGKCIDLTGASAVNGAAMQQWTCLGPQQQNQVWVPNWPPAPPDYDTIDLPVARPRQTAQGAPLF